MVKVQSIVNVVGAGDSLLAFLNPLLRVDRFGIPGSIENVIEFFYFTGEGVAEREKRLLGK